MPRQVYLVPHLHRGRALLAPATACILCQAAPQLCRARTTVTAPTEPDQAQGGAQPGAGVQGCQGQARRATCRTQAMQGVRGVRREHVAHVVDAARAGARHALWCQACMSSPSRAVPSETTSYCILYLYVQYT